MSTIASLFMAPNGPAPFENPAASNFRRNAAYVAPGPHVFNTPLSPDAEDAFRGWLFLNHVPFNPEASVSDYDMRGFYGALQAGDPRAKSAIDPNDGKLHYPDFWKTPYHETFSNQSKFANSSAPAWTPDDKLVDNMGRVIFDDRAR